MKIVPKLTIFRCPLGGVATPVAPVNTSIRKSAANLDDVNCVRLKILQCERLPDRCLGDTKHTHFTDEILRDAIKLYVFR